ncbi:MAG TPA: hypothetical protein VFI13_10520, partial [Gemmatimonadales bacterium]|nr:hypothetical protein [Gemmatimonadales bacterium]
TGTTNEGADAWFVGYTPEIAAGVWIGFDKPRPILDKATGGELAAPVWGRMLARVYQKRPAPKPWTAPADVIPHWVDPSTGLVIKEGCAPQHGFARPELFLKGKEPAAYCPGKEAPPANPFPTDRRLLQRNQEERQEAERLAEQRAAEQRAQAEREAKQKEQERLARLEQEEGKKEQQEQARLAEIAREEQQKKEKLAAARKAAETEKERAALKAREERIAREEAAANHREAEIAAREKEEREKEHRAKETAAREEARLQKLREQRNDEDVDPTDVREAAGPDLSGWWELTNTIASTNYAAYRGLRLTYRLQLEQDGDRLTGRGQKWAEEGAPVSAAARSPISVTGRIEGNKVTLQFTERGARRDTTGSFAWTLAPNGNALHGTFWSTAANTSGSSVARRMR